MRVQQHGGRFGQRSFIIGQVNPVGRADFHQARAGLCHHIGDAKPAADFNQLSA